MAASVSSTVKSEVPGAAKQQIVIINPGTYATNGVAVTAAILGLTYLDYVIPIALGKLDGTVNNYKWDQTNGKILLYNGSTEVTNATDLSTYTVICLVQGKP